MTRKRKSTKAKGSRSKATTSKNMTVKATNARRSAPMHVQRPKDISQIARNKTPTRKTTQNQPCKAVARILQNNKDNVIQINLKHYRDNKGGHPHVIVDTIDNNNISVGINHKKLKGKGATNKALKINPLGDENMAYLKRQGTVANKKSYFRPQIGAMDKEDYEIAKKYGNRAKEKYLNKKK